MRDQDRRLYVLYDPFDLSLVGATTSKTRLCSKLGVLFTSLVDKIGGGVVVGGHLVFIHKLRSIPMDSRFRYANELKVFATMKPYTADLVVITEDNRTWTTEKPVPIYAPRFTKTTPPIVLIDSEKKIVGRYLRITLAMRALGYSMAAISRHLESGTPFHSGKYVGYTVERTI